VFCRAWEACSSDMLGDSFSAGSDVPPSRTTRLAGSPFACKGAGGFVRFFLDFRALVVDPDFAFVEDGFGTLGDTLLCFGLSGFVTAGDSDAGCWGAACGVCSGLASGVTAGADGDVGSGVDGFGS